MKNGLKYVVIICLLFIQACDTDDCEDYLCFTPPMGFTFEIVDKETGENLFTNGTYSSSQIQVLNIEDNSKRQFVFLDENDINLISIGSIGWDSKIAHVVLKIADNDILNLYVDSERVSENCCSFSRYNEIRIDKADYEQDAQSDIYTVYID